MTLRHRYHYAEMHINLCVCTMKIYHSSQFFRWNEAAKSEFYFMHRIEVMWDSTV